MWNANVWHCIVDKNLIDKCCKERKKDCIGLGILLHHEHVSENTLQYSRE